MAVEIVQREFQARMTGEASALFRRGRKSVLIQSPTGSGKTVMSSWMIQQTIRRAQSAWFICHRVELLAGTSNTFHKYGMDHGYIAASLPMDCRKQLMICSIDTLKNRLAVLKAPKLAIFDEAHHCGAAGWATVLQWLLKNGTYVIGLSATPERLDGVGLDEYFQEMVQGPQPAWLMEMGYLSTYRMFCPNRPKIDGKFSDRKAAEAMKKMPKLVGDMIGSYRQNMDGLNFIGFAINVASSMEYAAKFTAAGIPCAHIDGGTAPHIRAKAIKDFADGRLAGLWNVGIMAEGFDLSAVAQKDVTVDGLIDAQATESYALQKQKWGRILRPREGKVAMINDHAGNDYRHGYPDDEERWSLRGDVDRSDLRTAAPGSSGSRPPPVHCKKCFRSIKRPLPRKCPNCDTALPDELFNIISAKKGQLVEVDEEAKVITRRRRKQEEMDCRNMQELIALAVQRGIKSPQTWASEQWSKRMAKYSMM